MHMSSGVQKKKKQAFSLLEYDFKASICLLLDLGNICDVENV